MNFCRICGSKLKDNYCKKCNVILVPEGIITPNHEKYEAYKKYYKKRKRRNICFFGPLIFGFLIVIIGLILYAVLINSPGAKKDESGEGWLMVLYIWGAIYYLIIAGIVFISSLIQTLSVNDAKEEALNNQGYNNVSM